MAYQVRRLRYKHSYNDFFTQSSAPPRGRQQKSPGQIMRPSMLLAIKIVVPAFLVLLLVIYGLISFLIASGVTKADRKEQEDHPSAYGLEYEDVEFVSRRGDVTLRGWYIKAQGEKPTLIFVHGNGSVRSGDRAVDLASRLARNGFNVLMFDLRGHGSSEGDQVSGGYFEQSDVLGAFDFLAKRGVSPGRTGLVGVSMGAATAVLAAAREPGIGALVADSPYAKASELIAHEAARKTVIPGWLTPIFVPTSVLMANWFYGIDLGTLNQR